MHAASVDRLQTAARATVPPCLTQMAPDIQEQILSLQAVDGIEPISERAIRKSMTTVLDCAEQRLIWTELDKQFYVSRR